MTVIEGIMYQSRNCLENFQSYSRLLYSFLKKTKPVESLYNDVVKYIKSVLTANKKLKVARYRVNHLRYRLHQMEQLIDNNNPSGSSNGKSLNLLR